MTQHLLLIFHSCERIFILFRRQWVYGCDASHCPQARTRKDTAYQCLGIDWLTFSSTHTHTHSLSQPPSRICTRLTLTVLSHSGNRYINFFIRLCWGQHFYSSFPSSFAHKYQTHFYIWLKVEFMGDIMRTAGNSCREILDVLITGGKKTVLNVTSTGDGRSRKVCSMNLRATSAGCINNWGITPSEANPGMMLFHVKHGPECLASVCLK